ncbi:MAG TPA: SpoIID/LytB domain-containing protein, partial [Bacteroidales bacterium]|nr:SpoIID/LytB domain-containing protein [Bacteroidales bacterium]
MRYWKSFIFSAILIAISGVLYAADIRVGLFYGANVQSVVFSVVEGEYILSGDGRQIAVVRRSTMLHIEISGSGLVVSDTLQTWGNFVKLEFKGVSTNNVFLVKPVFPSLPSKESEDYLSIVPGDKSLLMINILDLEKYIPGTVEAEGGSNAGIEYYKAQAVLTRTFAIKNFTRHATRGFNLCDGVHCQAFKGKSHMNRLIYDAVNQTVNKILVDEAGNPIMTAYHANCGGLTCSASMAWNKDLPYLTSVHDPFCAGSSQRNWVKTIPLKDWNNYLSGKGVPVGLQNIQAMTGAVRQKFLYPESQKVSMSMIRDDFKLKSSFFTV